MLTLAEIVQPAQSPCTSGHEGHQNWAGGEGTKATKVLWALKSASARGDKAPRDSPGPPPSGKVSRYLTHGSKFTAKNGLRPGAPLTSTCFTNKTHRGS